MTQTTLTFRQATAEDVSQVRALVYSAYRGDSSRQGWTTEADLLDDERIDDAGVLAKITTPGSTVLVAHDEEGRLATCCEILKHDNGSGYFGMFAVDPTRQAGGIGRQVIAQAERFAKEAWGLKRMEMSVLWAREELIAWYERRGYKKTGKTAPFPYETMLGGKDFRKDLYFIIMAKDL